MPNPTSVLDQYDSIPVSSQPNIPNGSSSSVLDQYDSISAPTVNTSQQQATYNASLPFGGQWSAPDYKAALAGGASYLLRAPQNLATGALALANQGGINTQSQTNAVNSYFNNLQNKLQPTINKSPGAANLGGVAGAITENIPALFTPVGEARLAGEGLGYGAKFLMDAKNYLPASAATAATAYLGSDPNSTQSSKLGNAALSGLGTAASFKAMDVAGNLWRGVKGLFTSPTELSKRATATTLASINGDYTQATPYDALNTINKMTDEAMIQKNAMFKARDDLAEQEGVKVPLTNLLSAKSALSQEKGSNEINNAIGYIDQFLEGAKGLPENQFFSYPQVKGFQSNLGKDIDSAYRQGNASKAEFLGRVKTALNQDTDLGIYGIESRASEQLRTLHNNATDYFKNFYLPLQNADTRNTLAAHNYSDNYFLSNALPKIMYGEGGKGTIDVLKQGINPDIADNSAYQQFASAHINALQNSATKDGLIDAKKYGNSLISELDKNRESGPLNDIKDKMQGLNNALDVVKQYQMARGKYSDHSLKQSIALMGLGATGGAYSGYQSGGGLENAGIGALLGLVTPKGRHIYTAGRLLKNPETAALLKTSGRLPSDTSPIIKNYYNKKVAQAYIKQAATIPSKLVPYFDAPVAQPQNQQ